MKFSGKLKEAPVGFQIAPMIDVVFLLLIFFVTSQIFAQWEAEIGIDLPTAKTAEENPRTPGEIILNVARDGKVYVGGQALDDEKLGGVLRDALLRSTGSAELSYGIIFGLEALGLLGAMWLLSRLNIEAFARDTGRVNPIEVQVAAAEM